MNTTNNVIDLLFLLTRTRGKVIVKSRVLIDSWNHYNGLYAILDRCQGLFENPYDSVYLVNFDILNPRAD